MKLKRLSRDFVIGFFIGSIFLGFLFVFYIADGNALPVNYGGVKEDDVYTYLKMFNKVFSLVRQEYVDKDKIKARRLIYGAIRGMLSSLNDEHTAFMEPKILKELNVETSAEFGGLGIIIGIRDHWLTVISPIDDTPAMRAGIQAGDKIIEINGVSTKGITVEEAVSKLRGPKGSSVTITILRRNVAKPFKVTIVRDIIKIKTVKSKVINNEIGYIRITQFSRDTADGVKKALIKFKRDKNIKGVIVDVRNNPGGLLSAAIDVSDLFVDAGKIVYTRGRGQMQSRDYYARQDTTILRNKPMVVLVNQGSASASEIFAGAMQDLDRAILVGTTTFGKGSVQTVQGFKDGSGIRITIAKYYTPSGRCIHKVGLTPDIVVKEPDLTKTELIMMDKLISGNYIKEFLKENPDFRLVSSSDEDDIERYYKLDKDTRDNLGYAPKEKVENLKYYNELLKKYGKKGLAKAYKNKIDKLRHNKELLDDFISMLGAKEIYLPKRVIKKLIRNEINKYNVNDIVDLDYDNQLKIGLSIVRSIGMRLIHNK